MTISYQEQQAAVAREIALRRNVYKKRVANHQMTQAQADLEIARMEAVMTSLKLLEQLASIMVPAVQVLEATTADSVHRAEQLELGGTDASGTHAHSA